MFKKIGKYLLSAALVFTSVFAVAGCGKDDGDDSTAISETDWKNGINYNTFKVRTAVDVTPEDTMVGTYEINYNDSNYEIVYNNIFYPDSEGGGHLENVNYLNGGAWKETYKYNSTTMSWYWDVVTDDTDDSVSDEYDANISGARGIVWFVKNNQSQFTKDKGVSVYRYTINGGNPANYVANIKEAMGATTFSIETIVVTKNNENKYLISLNSNSGDSIVTISFDDVSAIDSIVEREIKGTMARYKLVNNSGDDNRVELDVASTGFHVVSAFEDIYYKNDDGTYAQYYKNGESYQVSTITETQYNDAYKKFVTAHTFDWSNVPLATFKLLDGKYVTSGNVNLTDTGTRYEYYFSNIVVDPESRTITWNYKVHDKATNQDSPVYPIVVSTVFTEITYPTVG